MAYFNGKKIFFSPKIQYNYNDIVVPEIKDDVLILTQHSDKNKAEILGDVLTIKNIGKDASDSAF